MRKGRACVRVEKPCPKGTVRKAGRCVPALGICPKGMVRKGRACVRVEKPCPKGTVRRDRRCVPRVVRPIRCKKGQVLVRGRCVARPKPQHPSPNAKRPPRKGCPRGTVRTRQGCIPLRIEQRLRRQEDIPPRLQ